MEIFLDDGASYKKTVLANLLEHFWPHIWNDQRTKNKNKTKNRKLTLKILDSTVVQPL